MSTTWVRNDYAKSSELVAVRDRIGDPNAPATGTLLARLVQILSAVDGLEGFTDSLEASLTQVATDAKLEQVRALLAGVLSVESRGVDTVVTQRNADDQITHYTEAGVARVITYDADGLFVSDEAA